MERTVIDRLRQYASKDRNQVVTQGFSTNEVIQIADYLVELEKAGREVEQVSSDVQSEFQRYKRAVITGAKRDKVEVDQTFCFADFHAGYRAGYWSPSRPAVREEAPEGFKLVPVHATSEMIKRGKQAHKEEFLYHEDANLNIQSVWKAMVAVSPNGVIQE